MKPNGQNSPSSSETQQNVERTAQRVPGPFYFLWTIGGVGVVRVGGLIESELSGD